jgi:hypothetical protein
LTLVSRVLKINNEDIELLTGQWPFPPITTMYDTNYCHVKFWWTISEALNHAIIDSVLFWVLFWVLFCVLLGFGPRIVRWDTSKHRHKNTVIFCLCLDIYINSLNSYCNLWERDPLLLLPCKCWIYLGRDAAIIEELIKKFILLIYLHNSHSFEGTSFFSTWFGRPVSFERVRY